MVKRIVLLLFLLLLLLNARLWAKDYIFEPITSTTGITFNAINSVAEDKFGFIWFGCNSGLYRYNSSEIEKINFSKNHPEGPKSTIIRRIYKDKNDKLWICTGDGINVLNEETNSFIPLSFTNENTFGSLNTTLLHQHSNNIYVCIINAQLYYFDIEELTLNRLSVSDASPNVSYFTHDDKNNLYIASNNGTIYKTDSLLQNFQPFYTPELRGVSNLSFLRNQLWVGYTNDGIEVISEDGQHLTTYSEDAKNGQVLLSNRTRRIIEGPDNDVWVGMSGGISIIGKDSIQHIVPKVHNGLPHDGIFDLFLDRNKGVWVATWSGGLAYYHNLNYKFKHIKSSLANVNQSNTVISAFSEDKQGNIWVGSENHGLFIYNTTDNQCKSSPVAPISRIKSIVADKKQRLWFGTFYEGLWMKNDAGFQKMGDADGIFSTVLPVDSGTWVGQRGGGAIFYNEKKRTSKFYNVIPGDSTSISSNLIWYIFKDSKNNLWFCSDNGISVRFKNQNHFTNFYKEENGLSSDVNYTFAEDKTGKIWIGTAGSGIDIYDPKTKTFSKFALNEPIKNADVYCILKDHKGNIWFSSNQGIYAYYHDAQILKVFTREDGLLGQQFHPNSGFVSKKGHLYFGGGNGFNVIDPEIVHPNTSPSEIYLSKLTVNNQSFEVQKPKNVNSQSLPAVNSMELNYKQNSIGMSFVTNSYIKNSKSSFKYRLLNYIDEWNTSEYNTNISFTKIPPGDYIFQIEYLNNDGLNVAPLKEIHIEINPPFWLSWYAYLIYFLLAATVVFIAVRELRFREKSRAENLLFTEKVKFFTNVSHEFRTPLTLIISPINTLLKKYVNEPHTHDNLRIIQRNAERLLRLTNQILDFRLIEINNTKLKREKVDVVSLCKGVYDCFEYQSNEKEINCIFNSSFRSFELYVDEEKLEKVVYNIFSNALKYSHEKGQIIFSIEQKTLSEESYANIFSVGNKFIGNVLEVKIKDNGKGIKKSILNNIFDRFYVDAENSETGSGIGLHICQEYIRLHNGNIMVESEPGKETVFSINIPIESQVRYEKENVILQSYFDRTPDVTGDEDISEGKTKKVILFAEDNNELRVYYKNLLSYKYKVISAKNGSQAFEIASELVPDLIVSDILMPGMDGVSLTEKIRNTPELNHIPIILLTALSDEKVKIESMNKGANTFITKPVKEDLLFAKIDSLLAISEVVQKKFKSQSETVAKTPGVHQSFIEKVEQIVINNIQNQSFEITELASLLGVSRSSLQRKIKKTVNMSPSEFIREVRLKKAVVLLKNDEYNIDEIAIIVGFNSTSYFIRSFKKKYEMTPTAYKQNIGK